MPLTPIDLSDSWQYSLEVFHYNILLVQTHFDYSNDAFLNIPAGAN